MLMNYYMMKIKVCGITQLVQMKQLEAMGVDYAGMIFFHGSPRYILKKLRSIDVHEAGLKLQKVGVFVNASQEDIMTQVELYGLDLVQLHGYETPAFCRHIRKVARVIKAFRLNSVNEKNIDWMVKPYEHDCDHYLFDFHQQGLYGGTGEKFNWAALAKSTVGKSFFLSGGIGPDDVEAIRNFHHPFLHAIDINSKFETIPGVKDMAAIKKFIDSLNT